jgi:CHAT domain-containing protein
MQSKGVLTELLALRHRLIEREGDRYLVQLYHQAEMAAASGDEAQWKAAVLRLDTQNPAWLPSRLFDEGTGFLAHVGARLGARTLVSVIRYTPFDFRRQSFGAPHYLALCLRGGEVKASDIGPADQLDLMVQRYRAEAAAAQDAAAPPRLRALARSLYSRMLAPVLGERVADGDYVADLDGMLNLLPLESLVDGSGRYLVEAASWRYVSSARALLRDPEQAPAAASSATPATALLLVDPAFSAAPAAPEPAGTGGPALRAVPAAAAGLGRFQPLPETLEEGRAVSLAVGRMGVHATVLSGADADVAALAAARGPRFLHIATHGFFLDDQAPAAQGMMSTEAASGGMAGGIALAGVNLDGAPARGDGLFFISQFRTLDLNGTELVVMSACDTGVGTVRAGEGLNSLRQSLELAGARAQVTALWKVPSAATTRLMARFYDNLADGASKAQALRQAKLAVMKTWPNPLYWAGFTFAGEE